MSRGTRAIALVMLCALTTSCASSSGKGAPTSHVTPPEPLTTTRPDLVASGVTPNAARPTNVVSVQVVVNADGRPDMKTLKITGPGAETNRASVTAWVEGLRFKPAMQDGQPVSGTFTKSFDAMVRTRVVR
jgi:hypothetical protein